MHHSQPADDQIGAIEVHGMTRASFILRGAIAAGAAFGSGAVAPYVSNALAASFGAEEAQHVAALTQAVRSGGGQPAKMPKFVFPATDQASFLSLAYTLENV